jgi:hypothetical protein
MIRAVASDLRSVLVAAAGTPRVAMCAASVMPVGSMTAGRTPPFHVGAIED